ncbi:TM2 domain-containing protein [Exiguobacterium algae]|uniref:TM2 domain-containing protein n=1 Tax=Exiguobacterium algae TaxID=2751250 RepID=UPI001BE9B79A|nr:TM2 domain-containing protein [Exiguobacterium algae]
MNPSKANLSTEDLLFVNSEVEKRKRNMVVAYLLWFFVGALGAHRYYFGKTKSAIAMTLIVVLTIGIGTLVTGIWALVDAFLMPKWSQEEVETIERETIEQLQAREERTAAF